MKTSYVVIEQFGGNPTIVTDPVDGTAQVFNDIESAKAMAEECQDGIVVPLVDIIGLLERVSGTIDVLKFESYEEDDDGLEDEINEIIY